MTSESCETASSATVSMIPVSRQESATRTHGDIIVRKQDKEIKRLRKVAKKNKIEIKRLIRILDNRRYLANDMLKDFSSDAAMLMAAQFRNKSRSAKGRRWTYLLLLDLQHGP